MSMIRAGAALSVSVVIKLLSGLVMIKLMALYLSVEEFGRVGQFTTLIAIMNGLAGGAITSGLIRNFGANKDNDAIKTLYLRSAYGIWLISSLIIVFILVFFAEDIASFLADRPDYYYVLYFAAVLNLFAGLNNIHQATLSGNSKINHYAISQIIGLIIGTIVFTVLLIFKGGPGAIIGMAALPLFSAFASGWFVWKNHLVRREHLKPVFDKAVTGNLLSFSFMLIVGIVTVPGALIFTRTLMADQFGWQEAGYWMAVVKLSELYIQFFGLFFLNYAMVQFSAAKSRGDLIASVISIYKLSIPLSLLAVVAIWLLKDLIVQIAFSREFLPITKYMPYQLTGDFFRLIEAVISYVFLARRKIWWYCGLEIYQAIVFVGSFVLLSGTYSTFAAVGAHLITYTSLVAILALAGAIYWHRYRGELSKALSSRKS